MLNLTHAVRAVFLMWLQRDTLKRLPLADLGLIEECLKDESCRHATHDIFQTMNLKLDDKTFLRFVGRIIITTKLMRKMETLCGVGATICSGCDKNELTVQLLTTTRSADCIHSSIYASHSASSFFRLASASASSPCFIFASRRMR